VLARLGQRGYLLDRDDPVFPGDEGWLDGSALRRRFVLACNRADVRVLRFHDLRHRFGSNFDQPREPRAGPGMDGPGQTPGAP
jgi:integrase